MSEFIRRMRDRLRERCQKPLSAGDSQGMDAFDLHRPVINLALSVDEAMLLQSCLCMMAYAADGDMESVAIYIEGAPSLLSADDCDRLGQNLSDEIAPYVRATRERMEAEVERLRLSHESDDE